MDGDGFPSKEKYICFLMEQYIDNENYIKFDDAIEDSIGPRISYEGWLYHHGITPMQATRKQIQEARHAWLDGMIEATKIKLQVY